MFKFVNVVGLSMTAVTEGVELRFVWGNKANSQNHPVIITTPKATPPPTFTIPKVIATHKPTVSQEATATNKATVTPKATTNLTPPSPPPSPLPSTTLFSPVTTQMQKLTQMQQKQQHEVHLDITQQTEDGKSIPMGQDWKQKYITKIADPSKPWVQKFLVKLPMNGGKNSSIKTFNAEFFTAAEKSIENLKEKRDEVVKKLREVMGCVLDLDSKIAKETSEIAKKQKMTAKVLYKNAENNEKKSTLSSRLADIVARALGGIIGGSSTSSSFSTSGTEPDLLLLTPQARQLLSSEDAKTRTKAMKILQANVESAGGDDYSRDQLMAAAKALLMSSENGNGEVVSSSGGSDGGDGGEGEEGEDATLIEKRNAAKELSMKVSNVAEGAQ